MQIVTPEHDKKLQDIKAFIENKIQNPINANNKKILIFSAFTDTVNYLYQNLALHNKEAHNLETAKITGSIFDIELKKPIIPNNVLKVIDNAIPYQILYQFIYNDNVAYGITLKENRNSYYFSEWNEILDFDFTGIDLEIVYQKLIKAFINNEAINHGDFQDIIDTDNQIRRLEKEIAMLDSKIRKEKQFNRKVDLHKSLLEKQQQLKNIRAK